MKIPKYVEKLIAQRCKLASDLNAKDFELSEWLERNGIEVDTDDIFGGCEMYVNPASSANRIRKAIERK